eukprot:TRINITY_DN379_c0_g1_i1.p1 TRINITY_DN379_c0_g1~~TRINITY_DN379_c0_g1_i1.p1  ORF type:complete len:548 (+),score=118.60 TRINITY_DN379_c0_g1_i1:165-1808(+)
MGTLVSRLAPPKDILRSRNRKTLLCTRLILPILPTTGRSSWRTSTDLDITWGVFGCLSFRKPTMAHLFLISLISIAFAMGINGDVGFKVGAAKGYTAISKSQNSTLYTVDLADPAYDWPIFVADLHGSRYNMGYDYGVLLGQRIESMYWTFLAKIIGDTWEDELIIDAIQPALDWQWDNWLSAEVPTEFLEEIAGIGVGGHQVGVLDLDRIVTRVICLANAPGDMQDFILILLGEWDPKWQAKYARHIQRTETVSGLQCSMFGVWGSRTTDGSIYTARNLDWNKDTGMAKFKLITVFHPDDGKYAHATNGFAGLYGALTGMSSQGLTVHEANLEENEITWNGFPWVLRLRYIMENAANLEEAKTVWEATNNTVGFNHMVGSGSDAQSLVFETMHDYTAYFLADDPREANAVYKSGDETVQIGFPLKEALWRTNHGYDPVIREHYEWSQSNNSWSFQRYMFLYRGFTYYEDANIQMDDLAAINMTSIVGDKGHHAYSCYNNTDGTNVLSATYHPAKNQMYVAWEDGTQDSWRPACCNTYVLFDMTEWW